MNVKIISVLAHVEYTIPPICQLPNVKVFRCAGPGKRLKTTEPKAGRILHLGLETHPGRRGKVWRQASPEKPLRRELSGKEIDGLWVSGRENIHERASCYFS